MAKRIVSISLLPGEPMDGSGRVCIHLVVRDKEGTYIEPHMFRPVFGEDGKQIKQKVEAGPERVRLACSKKTAYPETVKGVTRITSRTDDPRGVTCPKCMATEEYATMMQHYRET